MRYLVSFACALALAPSMVAAQSGESSSLPRHLQRPARESATQPATESEAPPKVDMADTADAPPPVRGMQRWHPDAYADPAEKSASDFKINYASPGESDEVDPGVRRAKIGIGVSAITMFVGGCVAGAAAFSSVNNWNSSDTSSQESAIFGGSAIVAAGAVSMISTGILLGVRKRKARRATSAHWRGR